MSALGLQLPGTSERQVEGKVPGDFPSVVMPCCRHRPKNCDCSRHGDPAADRYRASEHDEMWWVMIRCRGFEHDMFARAGDGPVRRGGACGQADRADTGAVGGPDPKSARPVESEDRLAVTQGRNLGRPTAEGDAIDPPDRSGTVRRLPPSPFQCSGVPRLRAGILMLHRSPAASAAMPGSAPTSADHPHLTSE